MSFPRLSASGYRTTTKPGGEANEPEKAERQHRDRHLQPLAQRRPVLGALRRVPRRLQGRLRDVARVVPRPRGDLPRAVRFDHGRRGQELPARLLAPEHPGLRLRREGPAQGRRSRPGHRDLPVGQHRDRVRLDQEGQDEGADLHRRARLHRDRAQELGALRDRHGDLRDHAGLRRERLRHRPAAGARQGRQGQELAGDGPPDRDLQALPRGLRRDPGADERRGHALRRGRVRAEQARPGHDRAEVGAGRQVHRRRDPRRRPGARAGAQAPRLHRDPRPDAAGRRRGVQEGRDQGVRAPLAPRLRRPRGLPQGSGAPAQGRLQAHHAEDRRLRDAGAGDGAALGRRGEDRPADDRRRAGRHRA